MFYDDLDYMAWTLFAELNFGALNLYGFSTRGFDPAN